MLALRHPASQLSFATATLLACLFVTGCRVGLVSLELGAAGLAALFSTGVETAFGRMLPWAWTVRQLGMKNERLVLTQFVGPSIAGSALLVISLCVASPLLALSMALVPPKLTQAI